MASPGQSLKTSQFTFVPVMMGTGNVLPVFLRTEVSEVMGLQTVSLKEFLGYEMSLVKEVEAVLTAREGNVFHICTVVNDSSPEVRARVFERERSIIDEFAECEFDFNVIARQGRDILSLVENPGLELTFMRK
jgi:hypothetical protein